MSTNTEWEDYVCELCWVWSCSRRSPLWLELTAQRCATGTSPVRLYNLWPPVSWSHSGPPSEKRLQPQVQNSHWKRLSYKLVTDGGCGAGATHAIETDMFLDVLGGDYWTSQWFGALCDHWCHWKWSPRIRYVLLWESTRGQGKVHVQSEIFSTSTQICTNLWSTTVKSAYLVLWWRFLLEWYGCVTTKGPTTADFYWSESQMEDVWSMFGWLKCIEA